MPKFARSTAYTGSKGNQNLTGQVRFATTDEADNPEIDDVAISPQTLESAVETLLTSQTGSGTLVAGTVTIANTSIASTDKIYIQRTAVNSSTTLGEITYTISPGASITVTSKIIGTPGSTQTGDLSSFTYFIVH